jgi:hypothetical protein
MECIELSPSLVHSNIDMNRCEPILKDSIAHPLQLVRPSPTTVHHVALYPLPGADPRWSRSGIYLPSHPPRGRSSLCVRTGLQVRWTVTADGGSRGGGWSSTTYPDEHRMYRTRLHLATAHDGLGPASAGLAATPATLGALVHVQLTRLHGAAAASDRGAATPGTLYASPHPLHSTTGVLLTIGRPTPPPPPRGDGTRAACFDPLRATSVALGTPVIPSSEGDETSLTRPTGDR